MPNNYLGFGIPDTHLVLAILQQSEIEDYEIEKIEAKKNTVNLQHDTQKLVVFHKIADHWVKGQELLQKKDDKDYFEIKNIAKARQSTVTDGKKIWEIIWQQQEK